MTDAWRAATLAGQQAMQRVAFLLVLAITLGLTGYSAACALGYAPWLTLPLQFGTYVYPLAGIAVQLGLSVLFIALCFFLPTNARIMALETSHRSFHIGMRDVARAYALAHAADRDGAFKLKSEFDSVRERIAFLRDHPDLAELEPSVLEVAAQMSHISRELAQVYSDRNVARARDFLLQRQHEIENFNERLDAAKAVATEMRGWLSRIEIDEDVAEAQLARLCDELFGILPELKDDRSGQDANATGDKTEADAIASPVPTEQWETVARDDARIVALLARRAAE